MFFLNLTLAPGSPTVTALACFASRSRQELVLVGTASGHIHLYTAASGLLVASRRLPVGPVLALRTRQADVIVLLPQVSAACVFAETKESAVPRFHRLIVRLPV